MRPGFTRRQLLATGGATAASLSFGSTFSIAQNIRGRALTRDVGTRSGRIRGVVVDNDIQAFYGVPYGASTGGANRFMPPKAPESWTGVRETINVGFRSPQPLPGPISEIHALHRANPLGEDCLHVNVFTPALDNGERPVMVWLHGGGFWSGSGDWLLYDGAQLADSEDVVVVAVTHRLNAFGFLHLPEIGGNKYAEASNVGLRDMVAALDWVQDNIENFGGNPDNVTVFGQSGGGGKVSSLTAMPGASGKLHRGIIMSGSMLTAEEPDAASEATRRFMDLAGVSDVDALQRMPWEQLNAAATEHAFRMGPTVDGTSLPAHPYSPAAPAISADVPLIIGNTEYEANFFPTTPLDPIEESTLEQLLANDTGADSGSVRQLIDVYRQGRPEASAVDLYQIILSDLRFGANANTQAERKAAAAAAPVWRYYFTWQSPVRDGKLKSYHCIDIPFAFNNVDVAASMTGGGQDRYALAAHVSGAFASFARTGDPNHKGLPQWPAFTDNRRDTLIFDNDVRVERDPYAAERAAIVRVTGSA